MPGDTSSVDFPTNRQPKLNHDLFSELPDLVILHILSHMYFQEAARTTILSKRFNSLWNYVNAINLSDECSGKSGDQFVSFVEDALKFHRRRDIHKFSVKFKYDVKYREFVDGWIKFAVQKGVNSLHLNFIQNSQFIDQEYKLPKFLYNNEKLVEFVTSCCKLSKNRMICWSSLKFLSLTRTKLNEGLISRILDGCPVLEALELINWSGIDRFKIRSDSLRVLRIFEEQRPNYLILPQDECLLEISCPNLVSLEVSGSLFRTRVRLSDLGSLVNAKMDFKIQPQRNGFGFGGGESSWYVIRDQDIAREVLESLHQVMSLTIGGWWFKVLSTYEAYNLSSPWSNRNCLTLRVPVMHWDHLGIASILYGSPFLERLVIELSYCSDMCNLEDTHASFFNGAEEYYWTSWRTISKCPLLHLEVVKVVNFQASSGVVTRLFRFLQFLVLNSKVLKEVVIQTSRYVTQGALAEVKNLLSVPAASLDAIFHFEPPHLWVVPYLHSM